MTERRHEGTPAGESDNAGERAAPDVGKRLRLLRDQAGLSLRALAERSGLSVNTISLIERGVNSPTVASLHMLATALQVPITELFRDADVHSTVFVKKNQRSPMQRGTMQIESLGVGLEHQHLEPFLVTLSPIDGESEFEPITHGGQEFVYCIEGTIAYEVGATVYELESGDALMFDASQPHRFQNSGQAVARILLVFATRSGEQAGRHQHIGS